MRVLVACEFSGIVRDAFAERGHDAWSCDLLPSETDGNHYQGDVLDILGGMELKSIEGYETYNGVPFYELSAKDQEFVNRGYINPDFAEWDLMIAHPPCPRLTNTAVRWLTGPKPPKGKTFEQMWEELESACAFYLTLRNAPIPKKAIENPIFHKYAAQRINPGKRQIVQPWFFGEKSFKATGFELIGLPPLRDTNRLIPPKSGTQEHKEWSKVHRASPGPDRWKERSRTLQGIADAMADQWG